MISRKSFFLTTTILMMSGCSWFGADDDCEGDDCLPRLLDEAEAERSWYCYGRPDETWECVNEPDTGRIASIKPRPQDPFVMPRRTAQQAPPPTPPSPEQMQVVVPDSDNLLAQPDNFYTVQLIAMRNETDVIEYARSNGLVTPLYARIQSENSIWYVLLLGIYPDQATAKSAKDEWERARVLKVQPWVRRLGPLQQAIRLALNES